MSNSRSPRAVRSITVGMRGMLTPYATASGRGLTHTPRSRRGVQPGARGDVDGRAPAAPQLAADLADRAVALGDHVVLVDRLEVLLTRPDEAVVVDAREGVEHATDHLAHAVLD